MKILILTAPLLLFSCLGTMREYPQDVPDRVVWTCVLPPAGLGVTKVEWTKVFEHTPVAKFAEDELVAMTESDNECAEGFFNFSQGRNEGDREFVEIPRSETLIIIRLQGLIDITKDFMRYVNRKLAIWSQSSRESSPQ